MISEEMKDRCFNEIKSAYNTGTYTFESKQFDAIVEAYERQKVDPDLFGDAIQRHIDSEPMPPRPAHIIQAGQKLTAEAIFKRQDDRTEAAKIKTRQIPKGSGSPIFRLATAKLRYQSKKRREGKKKQGLPDITKLVPGVEDEKWIPTDGEWALMEQVIADIEEAMSGNKPGKVTVPRLLQKRGFPETITAAPSRHYQGESKASAMLGQV